MYFAHATRAPSTWDDGQHPGRTSDKSAMKFVCASKAIDAK
jgi:hypothetical protein